MQDLEVLDGLDFQAGHGDHDELDRVRLPRAVNADVHGGQERLEMPADLVHIRGKDPAGREGLADRLMATILAHYHLLRYACERTHVAPVLFQQEGQILAGLEGGLSDDVMVSGESVNLRVMAGGRLHELAPHDVLALPHVVRVEMGKDSIPYGGRGVMILVHKVHEVLGGIVFRAQGRLESGQNPRRRVPRIGMRPPALGLAQILVVVEEVG